MRFCNCINLTEMGSLADWTIALITLIGILLALKQFILYRNELKNKIFIEFRQRFKSDPINIKVFEFISGNKETNLPTEYEVNHLIGFYEELHKMYKDKQLNLNDLIYFFGNYYIKVIEHPELSKKIRTNSTYWTRAIDLYKLIKENEKRILGKIGKKLKHKENLKHLI